VRKLPVAYLRKSRVTSEHHLSWEMQQADILALAERRGDERDLLFLSDWGRSGRASKIASRKEYARLLSMVANGEVSAVYGYSMSRLGRSLIEYVKLAELCRDQGVPIHLAKEGTLDYSTPSGRLIVNVLAATAQAEAEWGTERATDAMRVRLQRGDYIGTPPYGYRVLDGKLERNPDEPVSVVLDAFREAGSYNGAARILNAHGVKARPGRGKSLWSMTGVRAVITREAPELAVNGSSPGAKSVVHARFARLLRCHCGAILTPVRNQRGYMAYMCWDGHRDPRHTRPYVRSEGKLMPWIRDEAARLRTPERVRLADENRARRNELQAQRERLGWTVVDGLLARSQAAAKAGEIDAELERLDEQERIVAVPELDWSWAPAEINAVLRAVWKHVQLDSTMSPASAEWRVPQWRS
jgi:DNA invertase Pin-like site-specific DNA recombinase